jgi:hypothetical protein
MKQRLFRLFRAGTVCLLLATSIFMATASDSSTIRVSLQNTGADAGAAGSLVATLNPKASTVTIQASKLTPAATYSFIVDGQAQASFVADSRGRGRLVFANPTTRSSLLLDFDPRGKTVALARDNTAIVQAVVSGPGEPAGSSVTERVELERISDNSVKSATIAYQLAPNGKRTFTVNLSGVAGTNWSVFVDGIRRAEIEIHGRSGWAKFTSDPRNAREDLLDFDPRGHTVDIAQGTNLCFSGRVEARGRGANIEPPSAFAAFVPSTGLDPDGTARARYQVNEDASRAFSLELEDVPVGSYDFLADGTFQGTINVIARPSGTHGELEFASNSDNHDKLPMNFNPSNAVFAIQQGNSVFFAGQLTNLANSASGTNAVTTPMRIELPLFNTGAAPGKAKAKLQRDEHGQRSFEVEVEDAPAGDYVLLVGGTVRGTITVANMAGDLRGKIEFADEPGASRWQLDFDPLGQTISVQRDGTTYFQRLFPTGQ